MCKPTYYSILGLDQNANKEEIKSSFRKLAQRYHPDKNPQLNEAKSIFIIINNAYKILINVKTKKEYDNYINNRKNIKYTEYYKEIKKINPIIKKTISEFNYILWDIEDQLKRITIEDLNRKYNEKDLYEYILDLFRYLELEILSETYRYTNLKNKTKKEKLHLTNYFYLMRVEIDKKILSINLEEEKNTTKIKKLINIKNKLITSIGKIDEMLKSAN